MRAMNRTTIFIPWNDAPRRLLAFTGLFLAVSLPVLELTPYYSDFGCRTWVWDHGSYGTSTLHLCLWSGEGHSIAESLRTRFWRTHIVWIAWWLTKIYLYLCRAWKTDVTVLEDAAHSASTPLEGSKKRVLASTQYSRYSELQTSKRQIRLLYLDADPTNSEMLYGQLKVTSLEDKPDFDALSYVWSQPSTFGDGVILVNGQPVRILPNLYSALHELRTSGHSRGLWADSICINQQDQIERASQVTLMSSIYSSARNVHAWLGESGKQGQLGMNMLSRLVESDKDISTWSGFQAGVISLTRNFLCEPSTPSLTSLLDDDASNDAWVALDQLLERPYWNRLWVVQEMLLSNSVILRCGSAVYSWHGAADLLVRLRSCTMTSMPAAEAVVNGDALIKVAKLARLYCDRHSLTKPLSNWVHWRGRRKFTGLNFVQAAMMCRGRTVTDDRDRVFGLLGIAPLSGLVADYSLTVSEVYERAAQCAITSTGTLDVLSACNTAEIQTVEPGGAETWPSWVPDWRDHVGSTNLNTNSFFAAGKFKAKVDFPTPGVMLVRGKVVDFVDASLPSSATKSINEFIERSKREWDWFSHLPRAQDSARETDRQKIAFLHTMLSGGVHANIRNATSAASVDFWPWNAVMGWSTDISRNAVESHYGGEINDLLTTFNEAARQPAPTFFCTRDGRMGRGSSHVREGDAVAVLCGGRVPLLLRPVGDDYVLIGICYVYGLMYREALPESGGASTVFRLV